MDQPQVSQRFSANAEQSAIKVQLAQTEGAKCRCDAVWYGDTIAYGCKTCGLSSASCICVFCFDAGDHEGHDFYISRSDYGCCDCGDAYAWRQSGFCRHHPGPREDSDPAQLLPEATRRRAQLLIPAQVRRLVNFHPSVLPGVEPPPVPSEPRRTRSASSVSSKGTSTGSQSRATDEDSLRVLITGINLRVTEEQLREFLESKLSLAEVATLQNLELQRDEDSKASKGRAYINMVSKNLRFRAVSYRSRPGHGLCQAMLVKRLSAAAVLPQRGSAAAAGFDLSAAEATVIPAGDKGVVKTGLSIAIPEGTYARIAPRSGLAVKKMIQAGAGVVDHDYRGEVGVVLFNHGTEDFAVAIGDRVAQLILEKISTAGCHEVESLDETQRGCGGFGSTGVSDKVTDLKKQKLDELSTPHKDQSAHPAEQVPGGRFMKLYGSNAAGVTAIVNASGEVLRGSPLRMHVGPSAIAEAEKHLQALETNFEWLLNLGGFHDGLRKIIGQVFLDRRLFVQGQSAVEVLLRHSHLMEPSVRKLETNLMVDLMLDLDFKHRFAQVFTTLYPELVRNREGNQDTNELGDFTCQIFTRQDVTMELVRDRDLVKTLLECLWGLLRPALVSDSAPAVFNHESNIFRDHEIIQCSMDLLYVLDHSDIAREIIRSPRLSGELWAGWIQILISMQAMNPHKRRSDNHVEFTSPSWGNALTLHTDLGSNTWLILDAIEFKAELESVKDMAQLAWRELRSWMVQVHAAEGRVGAAAMEGAFDYEVSRGTSFHIPVNRVLALLLHQLCIRAPRARSDGSLVEQVFSAVGMSAESDIMWWMEHPLRALVLHWQVMAGMWRRNGEALEHESEFYRMNYWHHLLIDVDLLVLRMAALALRPETFFRVTLKRFELGHWLLPGDPMGRLLLREEPEQEFAMMKLQSFVLFLYQLLSWNTHLSLTWPQLVTHTTRQFLSVGPKSHSQLWDPRLERSTATATAKDQHMLEAALREISSFSEADGSGHNPAKYHLREDQWFAVDPYYHLFAWSEQQKVEENLVAAMKARGGDLSTWIEESARLQPPLREAFRLPFLRWCSSGMVQAFCWLLLVRLAFQKDVSSDGRLLVLALLLAIRSTNADGLEEIPPCGWSDVDMEVSSIPTEEVQLTWLAKAVTPLSHTATRKFCVQVTTAGAAKAELNVSLMDAVDRLVAVGGSVSSSLARGLRQRLLREAVPSRSESACHGDEDRKAKRRKAVERQQRMLGPWELCLHEAGRDLLETDSKSQEEQKGMDAEAGLAGMEMSPAECVVCMSHQEGEDSENPLGLICFLRPAVASSMQGSSVPTEQAVLLQQPKAPVSGPPRRPQCFEAQAPDGLVLARACSHRMHFSCWRSFRPASLRSGGDRTSCPYCGTVANALLPVGDIGESARFRLPLHAAGAADEAVDFPIPRRHADASDDFLACLEGQLRRLGQQHAQAACLPEALGATPGVAGPMMSLSKLCADSIALAEVRLRTRPAAALGAESSASASATSSASRRTLDGSETSAAALMLRGIIAEAIDATPPLTQVLGGKLATFLLSTTPHGRFQTLTALLLCLCKSRACKPSELGRARQLVHGFYLLEAVVVLSCLCDDALIEAGFHQASGHAAESESIWSLVQTLASTGQGADQSMRLTPIQTLAEAAKVLKLALNPFLFKVRMLLYLLSPDNFPSTEAIFTKSGMEVLPPAEDHSRLASGEDGLPEVEELLMLRPQNCRVDIAALTSLIGCIPPESLHRGLQPRSPLLLVLVDDAEMAEAPMHVWQVSSAGFSRLQASGFEVLPSNFTSRL
ncbi:dut [Symbiodinium sp. KB8]|nr:dut [Symbiodinium sp. KB8]